MTPDGPRNRALGAERIWTLLDRYLAGDVHAEEVQAVRDWLAADPARAQVLDDLRRIRGVAGHPPPRRGVDAAWSAFLTGLGAASED